MNLYAGIDGGQSSTVAVVGDATRVLGRGLGPPADLVGEARDSSRQRNALENALEAALHNAGLGPDLRLRAVVAGVSGFDEGLSRVPDLASRSERTKVVHDTAIAHAGALDGAPGIVVVAGTGSVALGNAAAAPDRFVRAGGWGYFFGDEGSALWVARDALAAAMRLSDTGAPGRIGERALSFFGARSLREIQHAYAHGELTRTALAGFAQEVLLAAAAGDTDADTTRYWATVWLADLVRAVHRRLPSEPRRVSFAGGLFANADFSERFARRVREGMPELEVIEPVHAPAEGALVLARNLR